MNRNQNPKNVLLNLFNKEPILRFKEGETPEEWQKKAHTKLCELLGIDIIEKCASEFIIEEAVEYEEYTSVRFSFQSEQGYFVPAYIWLRKNTTEKQIPMICLQGHSKGMHISISQPKFPGDAETISGGDRDFAVHAFKNGFTPIVMEQRYMGECGGSEKGPGCCADGGPQTIPATPTLLFGRTAIGERVWDTMRLIDVIGEQFDCLDMDNVHCMGNSGGGTTTFYLACVDKRVKLAMPSCSVCTYKDSIVNLRHCACNYIPGIARYFDMGDLGCLIAPRKLIVVAGKEDNIFPIAATEKTVAIMKSFYARLGAIEKVQLVIGDGGHRFYAEPAYNMLNKME